jgi:restriction modification system DNA specificity domain protein
MKDVTKLGNIADIYDGPHATPKKIENGKYFLSISSLDNGSLDLSKSAFISDKDFIKWTKRVQPQKGDLLFSYETRLGEAALMPDNLQACLGRRMGLLRPKKDKVIPQYLLFTYLSPEFQKVIRKNTIKGATVDRIALNELGNFPIYIPDLKTQQSIAAVLSALDKKIALNKQINAHLEEMAKTLYDYWFVQFDFPDANGKPYKSSGGDMVFDETLKREIPKGWKPFKLSELVTLSTGKEDANFATEQGIYPFFTCSEKILKCDVYSFDTQAILLAGNGTFSVKRFTGRFNAYQRTYVLEPKSKNLYPIVYFVIIDNVIKFTSGSRGSIIKFITRGDIENIDVVLPNDIENMRFSEVLHTYLLQAELLEKQNHHLTQLRDFLLPMLMNGQVSVAE